MLDKMFIPQLRWVKRLCSDGDVCTQIYKWVAETDNGVYEILEVPYGFDCVVFRNGHYQWLVETSKPYTTSLREAKVECEYDYQGLGVI